MGEIFSICLFLKRNNNNILPIFSEPQSLLYPWYVFYLLLKMLCRTQSKVNGGILSLGSSLGRSNTKMLVLYFLTWERLTVKASPLEWFLFLSSPFTNPAFGLWSEMQFGIHARCSTCILTLQASLEVSMSRFSSLWYKTANEC